MPKLNQILSHIPACAIEWDKSGIDSGYKLIKPKPCRIKEEAHGTMVIFSAENGDGVADYCSYKINADLEAWAKKFGSYFEWENPGAISVFFEGVQS